MSRQARNSYTSGLVYNPEMQSGPTFARDAYSPFLTNPLELPQPESVGYGSIRGGEITTSRLANNSVNIDKIQAGTITADIIEAGSITGDQIAADTITATNIAANTITATEVVANTITTNEIALNTITASNIAASTITTTQIAANTITASDIASGTITATQIASGTITATQIAAGTITASEIASNAITSAKIAAGTIVAADIASSTITTSEIATSTITGTNINAVATNFSFGRVYVNGSPAVAVPLHVAGSASKTTGTLWTAVSDRRLKKNIKPFSGLDIVSQLKPVTFKFKKSHIDESNRNLADQKGKMRDRTHHGFVAQDMEAVMPEWVDGEGDEYKTINPSGIESILTSAVQELLEKVETLQEEINMLKSK